MLKYNSLLAVNYNNQSTGCLVQQKQKKEHNQGTFLLTTGSRSSVPNIFPSFGFFQHVHRNTLFQDLNVASTLLF
jgi:hypothetical protein